MKEIFDTVSSRIKSPILGSIVVTFVLFNWKPLFFLFFSDETVLVKIEYFDFHTDYLTLYIVPTLAGIILALLAPYISYLGSIWAARPILNKRLLEDSNAHKILEQKNQLALQRKNQEAIYEQSLIDRAARDVAIKNIPDSEVREKLRLDVEASRSENETEDLNDPIRDGLLDQYQLDFLKAAIETKAGVVTVTKYVPESFLLEIDFEKTEFVVQNRREFLRTIRSISRLKDLDLLIEAEGPKYPDGFPVSLTVTQLGYDYVDNRF